MSEVDNDNGASDRFIRDITGNLIENLIPGGSTLVQGVGIGRKLPAVNGIAHNIADAIGEKIANDITEGSKVFGNPEKLALRAAAARQGLRADRQHRLNERYYTDAYGSKLFHDAMDGNIVTGDPAALELRAAAARQFFINDQKNKLAGRYFADALGAKAFHDAMDGNIVTPDSIQLRAANAAKAKAEAEANANAEAAAKAVEENPQPQAPIDVTADVMKAVKADGNTSFANWRKSLVNQGWNGDPSKIMYDPSTGKFMYNVSGQAVKSAGKPALDQQPQKAGKNNKPGKKPRMSDAEIDAFLNEELGNGTYASPGVTKGGTYASSGISSGGTYATGEGIKDANGNVLTNPGGDWEYQYALRNPQYGLGMMGKMSDAQKKYLQAVADDMGYKYNFTGAPRYV